MGDGTHSHETIERSEHDAVDPTTGVEECTGSPRNETHASNILMRCFDERSQT